MDSSAPKDRIIFVVDDDIVVRDAITDALLAHGLTVAPFSSGERAIEGLRELPGICLLITDINLGDGMTGFELGQISLAAVPDLRVIYISGLGLRLMAAKLSSREVFFRKPFRLSDLLSVVCETVHVEQ